MGNLIKIEGKALEKLISVVSKGIGTVYRPRAIRKEADAEAYRTEVLATANAKKELIEGEAKIELLERARSRLVNQEIIRQSNIEDVVEKAIPHLSENVSEEEVDQDWRTRFFQKAQDISDQDMQEIWARILAEEVSEPGRVSFRTLELVSNVSKLEAEVFSRACNLASNCQQIWKINNNNSFESYGFKYSDLMILREAGLVHDSDTLKKTHSVLQIQNADSTFVVIGEKQYLLTSKTGQTLTPVNIQMVAFTNSGSEICRLLEKTPNEEYFADLKLSLNNKYVLNEIPTKNQTEV